MSYPKFRKEFKKITGSRPTHTTFICGWKKPGNYGAPPRYPSPGSLIKPGSLFCFLAMIIK
jgi:hypothetical protein